VEEAAVLFIAILQKEENNQILRRLLDCLKHLMPSLQNLNAREIKALDCL